MGYKKKASKQMGKTSLLWRLVKLNNMHSRFTQKYRKIWLKVIEHHQHDNSQLLRAKTRKLKTCLFDVVHYNNLSSPGSMNWVSLSCPTQKRQVRYNQHMHAIPCNWERTTNEHKCIQQPKAERAWHREKVETSEHLSESRFYPTKFQGW